MLATLRRIFGKTPARRNLEAATTGRRWPVVPASDAKWWMMNGAATVGARANAYALNNPHGTRMVECLTGNLVGTGIVPRSLHPVEAVRQRLARNWLSWVDTSDPEGLMDFYGQTVANVRDMAVFGEALFAKEEHPDTNAPQLRRLHPEQLDRLKTHRLDDGGSIIQGVEFDRRGRRRAYWITPTAPGDILGGMPTASSRYPADRIIHNFRPLVPGQVRGLSWFAPILLPANELDQLLDAMLVRAKVASLFVGSITDADGSGADDQDGTATGSTLDQTVEPGSIRIEQPGKEMNWNEPPTAGDAPVLATETLRMLAVGAGLTYEQLSGDYSKVNYSSARAALLEFRRFCEGIQHHVIAFQWCRPVRRQFILSQVLQGGISATAYRADPEAFHATKWLPPAWQWVDPLKDAQAAVVELDNHLRSRTEIVAERGYDVEDLDREIAADAARGQRLGLTARKPALAAAQEEAEANAA